MNLPENYDSGTGFQYPQAYMWVTSLRYIKSDDWSLPPPAQEKISPSCPTLRFQGTASWMFLAATQVVAVLPSAQLHPLLSAMAATTH